MLVPSQDGTNRKDSEAGLQCDIAVSSEPAYYRSSSLSQTGILRNKIEPSASAGSGNSINNPSDGNREMM